MIVPECEQMKEFRNPINGSLRVSYRKVVVKSPRPLLERSLPPLDMISDSKRFLEPLQSERFERVSVPWRVVHDHDWFLSTGSKSFFCHVDCGEG